MENYIDHIKYWMLCDKLNLNDGKTAILIIGTRLTKVNFSSLHFGNSSIDSTDKTKNLGFWFNFLMKHEFLISILPTFQHQTDKEVPYVSYHNNYHLYTRSEGDSVKYFLK